MESTLTANELIDATREALLRSRYTELSLKSIERTWSNLKEYLLQQGLDYFTRDVGVAFLAHRYGLVTQSLSAFLQQIKTVSELLIYSPITKLMSEFSFAIATSQSLLPSLGDQ